jgi:hypothetical protein
MQYCALSLKRLRHLFAEKYWCLKFNKANQGCATDE